MPCRAAGYIYIYAHKQFKIINSYARRKKRAAMATTTKKSANAKTENVEEWRERKKRVN